MLRVHLIETLSATGLLCGWYNKFVRSVFPSNVHINILRALPCRSESLRLKFTNEPSILVDGDLAESIKRSASDRLGDLVPQVRARTLPGFFTAWHFWAFVLKLSFKFWFVIVSEIIDAFQRASVQLHVYHFKKIQKTKCFVLQTFFTCSLVQ